MADWYGKARTNHFRVQDPDAFKAELSKPHYEVKITTRKDKDNTDGPEFFALFSDSDKGGWESSYYKESESDDDESDEYVDFDLVQVVAPFLADGEVAVFMEAGAEKLCYISGSAQAVNNKGETRNISLDDIYSLAADLGPNITQASS